MGPFPKERRQALLRTSRWLPGHGYEPARVELRQALAELDGVRVNRHPPQVNLFQLWFDVEPETLLHARDLGAEEQGLGLWGGARPTQPPATSRLERHIGEAALELDPAEVVSDFARLLEPAGQV